MQVVIASHQNNKSSTFQLNQKNCWNTFKQFWIQFSSAVDRKFKNFKIVLPQIYLDSQKFGYFIMQSAPVTMTAYIKVAGGVLRSRAAVSVRKLWGWPVSLWLVDKRPDGIIPLVVAGVVVDASTKDQFII